MECGEFGVPTVSADYPQMRFWVDTFGLEARFFNARRPDEAALALKSAELERAAGTLKGRFKLPDTYATTLDNAHHELLRRLLRPDEPPARLQIPEFTAQRLQ